MPNEHPPGLIRSLGWVDNPEPGKRSGIEILPYDVIPAARQFEELGRAVVAASMR
jgi:hypothetical protein